SNPFQRRESRFVSAFIGAVIGLGVGIFWAITFGPLTDGPPSIKLSFLVYSTGFTITGLVVGAIRRLPLLVGIVTGSLVLSYWAIILGPKDAWGVLWVMVFGGSGLFWGFFIGCIYWLVQDWRSSRSSSYHKNACSSQDPEFGKSWPHDPSD